MKKSSILFFLFGLTISCGGPKPFNTPKDYVGSEAAAIATHCARTGGTNKSSMAYKICKEGFKTHYGR